MESTSIRTRKITRKILGKDIDACSIRALDREIREEYFSFCKDNNITIDFNQRIHCYNLGMSHVRFMEFRYD